MFSIGQSGARQSQIFQEFFSRKIFNSLILRMTFRFSAYYSIGTQFYILHSKLDGFVLRRLEGQRHSPALFRYAHDHRLFIDQ